jgi:hypothetical protein
VSKGIFEIVVRNKSNPLARIVEDYRKPSEDLSANESGDLKPQAFILAAVDNSGEGTLDYGTPQL